MTQTNSAGAHAATGTPSVWTCLTYRDVRAASAFLVEAFGFVERASYGDSETVRHAELVWPAGNGGVMLGPAGAGNECGQPVGTGSTYVVVDELDALFARATAAGARVVRGIRDEDYGGRGFTVRDPEGALWSFGTYQG
ncbi:MULTISPECIES: VOC family protein [Streptosporangium]|uniref:Glyoxalase superfamily protein PhnB n=1 Tax=Streptosporangium brasiliense TaxID=47480 RepID=A0ABT9R6R0_9ACTN|nr:VOC family protein [Streptosporangium brasiliense]MDP9864547.1 putative glyoxalase superfamily protein PhnB [Streptosporangium brasiliense]